MKVGLKSFEALEEKIQRAVDLVTRLKNENASLRAKMSNLELSTAEGNLRTKQFESMKVTTEQLERELKSLQDERQTVLSRIDTMLADLDKLHLD